MLYKTFFKFQTHGSLPFCSFEEKLDKLRKLDGPMFSLTLSIARNVALPRFLQYVKSTDMCFVRG